ncbi:MAG TPA: M28 family peptidase [Gemmatimonadaceae bacterium]
MTYRKSALAVAAAFIGISCSRVPAPLSPLRTVPGITPADTRSRIYLVADDSMQGREAGTAGNYKMTEYIAREMQRLGLEPGGENGTWFQTIPMVRRSTDSTSSMTVNGEALKVFTDFTAMRPTATLRLSGSLARGNYETIYGGRVGDSTVRLNPADVRNRIIVLDAALGANGQPTATYSSPTSLTISRYPEAAAVIVASLELQTANSRARGAGLTGQVTPMRTPFGILASRSAAERIMGAPLASLKPGARGRDVQADVRFHETPVDAPARNVIAIVRGSDPALRGEYVAIGAHSDHIGVSTRAVDHDSLVAWNTVFRPAGADQRVASNAPPTAEQLARARAILDSLRKINPPRRDSINNGADDDGSGSVALLEIAESLASQKHPRRSVLIVWHTAEESGLLGSAWFTEHTTVPHDSIIAQINMDMVGRGERRDNPVGGPTYLQVIGSRRLSTDLGNVLDSVNAARAVPWNLDYSFDAKGQVQNRYCRSDHYMYARTGIPIAYLSRGYHPAYHQVIDEPQYISYTGLANVATFVRDVATALANRNDRVRVDKPKPNPLAPCQQ